MSVFEDAIKAAGDVAATMDKDVRDILSERAIADVVRAVIDSIYGSGPTYTYDADGNCWIPANPQEVAK